jgi:hypothetical protein
LHADGHRFEPDHDRVLRPVSLWVIRIENEMITVKTARGQKAAQLGGSKPHQLAERLLRELAAEGKG